MAGRKPKPTALKLIDGNPGKRPLNEYEPMPAKVYNPEPPEGFDKVHVAKWNEIAAKLAAVRILTELDLDALEMYVREWVNLQDAIVDIAERGRMIKSSKNALMWNPSWSQYKHSQAVCRAIMGDFGMNPSKRSGIVAASDDSEKSRWSKF